MKSILRSRWLIRLALIFVAAFIVASVLEPVIFYAPAQVYVSFRAERPERVIVRWGDRDDQQVELQGGQEQSAVGLYEWSGTLPSVPINQLSVSFQGTPTTVHLVSAGIASNGLQYWDWSWPLEKWGELRSLELTPKPGEPSLILSMTAPVTEIRLAGFRPVNQLTGTQRVILSLYSLLSASVVFAAIHWWESWPRIPLSISPRLHWIGRKIAGQPLWLWVLAIPCVFAVSLVLVLQLNLDGQQPRPLWLQLVLDSTEEVLPPVSVRLGQDATSQRPFEWQPYNDTFVGVKGSDSIPSIAAISTEAGPLPLTSVVVREQPSKDHGLPLSRTSGGLMLWPLQSRAITVTFNAGRGRVDLYWLDQHGSATLGDAPVDIALRLPGQFQGWALLPAQEIDTLEIEVPAGSDTLTIRSVTLWDRTPQIYDGQSANEWSATGCSIDITPSRIVLGEREQACTVFVKLAQPIHQRNWTLTLGVICVCLLVGLLALRIGQIAVQWFGSTSPAAVAVPRESLHVVQPKWGMKHYAAIAFLVAFAYHLIFVLTLPLAYTPDSIGYYDSGRAFAETGRFNAMYSPRTPALPLLIAMVIRLFGDSVVWIAVLQHLTLALLAPLIVWSLYSRLSIGLTMLIGILGGCAPVVSVTANIVWTETLFAVCVCATLLVYAQRAIRLGGFLVVGMGIGAATMVRPTGLILLALLLGWIALRVWFTKAEKIKKTMVGGCIAILLGYVVIAGPWQYFLLMHEITDLSGGTGNNTALYAAAAQQRVTPALDIVRPDRVVWAFPDVWKNDVFLLGHVYPHLISGRGDYGETFRSEARREADRTDRDRLLENYRSALIYNLTFKWVGAQSFQYFAEISDQLGEWTNRQNYERPVPDAPDGSTASILRSFSYRRAPITSPIRDTLISMSFFVLRHWIWLSVMSLVSFPVLFRRSRHDWLPCWLFFVSLVLSASLLGMPVERYIIVAEPILYVVCGIALSDVLKIGLGQVRRSGIELKLLRRTLRLPNF